MRHDVERYKLLLKTETNPRVRKVLTNMIQELESRVAKPVPPATPMPHAATGGRTAKPATHFPV